MALPYLWFSYVLASIAIKPFELFHHSLFDYLWFRLGRGPLCGPDIYMYLYFGAASELRVMFRAKNTF